MRTSTIAAAVVAALSLAIVTVSPAQATTPTTVGKVAASWTPWLLPSPGNQQVDKLADCGDTMYAVGRISAVGQGTQTYSRGNAFSFSQTTGAMTAWDPQINGEIHAIALSPDCSVAYLGGKFTAAGASSVKNLVAVDTVTGAVLPTFKAKAAAEVDTLVDTAQGLLAGGPFQKINNSRRTRFASLDATTGAVTDYANLDIEGQYTGGVGPRIFNMQLSHAGTRLLVEGVFTSIAGVSREQMAVFDLGGPTVTLDEWNAPELTQRCSYAAGFAVRAGAWSPDDATIYGAATGLYPVGSDHVPPSINGGYCDAASAFPSTSTAVNHTWIAYTGCDSLYSIAADSHNVYIGGHQRWLDNVNGCDSPGPGSVARPGLAALDPATGLALKWNPTRALGHGADDLLLTDSGLWIASDTWRQGQAQKCAHQDNHGGLCFLPY